jgi:predicted  nucleic acid-binding Zn-ribbon protein
LKIAETCIEELRAKGLQTSEQLDAALSQITLSDLNKEVDDANARIDELVTENNIQAEVLLFLTILENSESSCRA